jgi:cytochrome c553
MLKTLVAAALAALLASPALAADAAAGKAKAEPCFACHGEDGNSQLETVPSLAQQPSYYLLMQLILFRDKQRDVEQMTPFVQGLEDADLENIAAYFSSQTLRPEPGPEDAAKMATGKQLAEAAHCGQCHLPNFVGREQMARLAGQREEYLQKALADFKAGERPGLDGTMTEAVYELKPEDLDTLAHYLAHFR